MRLHGSIVSSFCLNCELCLSLACLSCRFLFMVALWSIVTPTGGHMCTHTKDLRYEWRLVPLPLASKVKVLFRCEVVFKTKSPLCQF